MGIWVEIDGDRDRDRDTDIDTDACESVWVCEKICKGSAKL